MPSSSFRLLYTRFNPQKYLLTPQPPMTDLIQSIPVDSLQSLHQTLSDEEHLIIHSNQSPTIQGLSSQHYPSTQQTHQQISQQPQQQKESVPQQIMQPIQPPAPVVQPQPTAPTTPAQRRARALALPLKWLCFYTFIVNSYSIALMFFEPCRDYHHLFLVSWNITYLVYRGDFKKIPCLNLFLFIWGNLLLVTGNSCSSLVTLCIVSTLATNLEIYCVAFGMLACAGFCGALCCFCAMCCFLQAFRKNTRTVAKNQAIERLRKKKQTLEDIQLECSICFEKNLDLKLDCNHCFHLSCIQMWAHSRINCPICRSPF